MLTSWPLTTIKLSITACRVPHSCIAQSGATWVGNPSTSMSCKEVKKKKKRHERNPWQASVLRASRPRHTRMPTHQSTYICLDGQVSEDFFFILRVRRELSNHRQSTMSLV